MFCMYETLPEVAHTLCIVFVIIHSRSNFVVRQCEDIICRYKYVEINQPTRCINLSDLLLVVQIQLDTFRASSRPSSGAYKLQ